MIRIGTGILAAEALVIFLSLVKAAGRADRRSEEIQRLTAGREAGVGRGN